MSKLKEDAWNKPESVSEETYSAYLGYYKQLIDGFTGETMTGEECINLHEEALQLLIGNYNPEDTIRFRQEIGELKKQIQTNRIQIIPAEEFANMLFEGLSK